MRSHGISISVSSWLTIFREDLLVVVTGSCLCRSRATCEKPASDRVGGGKRVVEKPCVCAYESFHNMRLKDRRTLMQEKRRQDKVYIQLSSGGRRNWGCE